jgi:hypothetical protein
VAERGGTQSNEAWHQCRQIGTQLPTLRVAGPDRDRTGHWIRPSSSLLPLPPPRCFPLAPFFQTAHTMTSLTAVVATSGQFKPRCTTFSSSSCTQPAQSKPYAVPHAVVSRTQQTRDHQPAPAQTASIFARVLHQLTLDISQDACAASAAGARAPGS